MFRESKLIKALGAALEEQDVEAFTATSQAHDSVSRSGITGGGGVMTTSKYVGGVVRL